MRNQRHDDAQATAHSHKQRPVFGCGTRCGKHAVPGTSRGGPPHGRLWRCRARGHGNAAPPGTSRGRTSPGSSSWARRTTPPPRTLTPGLLTLEPHWRTGGTSTTKPSEIEARIERNTRPRSHPGLSLQHARKEQFSTVRRVRGEGRAGCGACSRRCGEGVTLHARGMLTWAEPPAAAGGCCSTRTSQTATHRAEMRTAGTATDHGRSPSARTRLASSTRLLAPCRMRGTGRCQRALAHRCCGTAAAASAAGSTHAARHVHLMHGYTEQHGSQWRTNDGTGAARTSSDTIAQTHGRAERDPNQNTTACTRTPIYLDVLKRECETVLACSREAAADNGDPRVLRRKCRHYKSDACDLTRQHHAI